MLAQPILRAGFVPLLTGSGIGQILGMTIMVETGEIERFATVGILRRTGSPPTDRGSTRAAQVMS